MTTVPVRLGAFAGGLAVAFGAAFAGGAAADPVTTNPAANHSEHPAATAHGSSRSPGHSGAGIPLPGLTVTDAGYTLVPAAAMLPSGSRVPFRFSITTPHGTPLTDYRVTHEKELHLIVVRRDLTGFQHVHPCVLLTVSGASNSTSPPPAPTASSPTSRRPGWTGH